jgi:hypothetical protein
MAAPTGIQIFLVRVRACIDDDKYPIAAQPGICSLIPNDA